MTPRANQSSNDAGVTLTQFHSEFMEFVRFVQEQFSRVQEQAVTLADGQAVLTVEVGHLTKRVGKLEESMEEVRDELHDLSVSVNDSLDQLRGHEKRIVRLEKKASFA